jgi:hypothetical protein
MWRSRWNVNWQGKPKFSEKTCPSATFVHHKIPHDQTLYHNEEIDVQWPDVPTKLKNKAHPVHSPQ